jgi:hypothetical protein
MCSTFLTTKLLGGASAVPEHVSSPNSDSTRLLLCRSTSCRLPMTAPEMHPMARAIAPFLLGASKVGGQRQNQTSAGCVQAYAHASNIVEFISRSLGSSSHPHVMPAWEYVESLHRRGGDEDGAAYAHKKALQCKSAMQRSRDISHKPKQLPQKRRR